MTGGTHPKQKTPKYTEEQLQAALQAVKGNLIGYYLRNCSSKFFSIGKPERPQEKF